MLTKVPIGTFPSPTEVSEVPLGPRRVRIRSGMSQLGLRWVRDRYGMSQLGPRGVRVRGGMSQVGLRKVRLVFVEEGTKWDLSKSDRCLKDAVGILGVFESYWKVPDGTLGCPVCVY